MPDRFGRDDNGDGIIDSYVPTTHCVSGDGPCQDLPATSPLPVAPNTWTVNLNACASEGDTPGQVAYAWQDIDNVGVTFAGGPGCNQFTATVPALATYRIGLTAIGPNGAASTVQEVVVQDLLIVSMGDSYGSGEGNPDKDQFFSIDSIIPPEFTYAEAVWQDRRCHRSIFAGSAQAALELERADPHTSVTFIHTACSGATLVKDPTKPAGDTSTGGILDPYNGAESPEAEATVNGIIPPILPQVDQVRNLIGNRAIDAMYVSIGGNDSNFAPIVISCIAQAPCNPVAHGLPNTIFPDFGIVIGACSAVVTLIPPPLDVFAYPVCLVGLAMFIADFTGATAEQHLASGMYGPGADLADPATWRITDLYGQLESTLFDPGGVLHGADSRSLFLSEYVDATKNDDGSYCPSYIWDVGRNMRLPGVSGEEFRWIDEKVEQKLSQAIAYNTSTRGWTFVDGIASAFRLHGTCAENSYMVGLVAETFMRQGNKSGAAHPNINGHRVYRNRILERWLPYLYPGPAGARPWIPGDFIGSPAPWVEGWIAEYPVSRPDQLPLAQPGGPYTVVEGSTVAAVNTSWDGDHDNLTHHWSSGNTGVATVSPASALAPTITAVDDGTTQLTLTVTDDDGTVSANASVTVTNADPVVTVASVGEASGFILPLVAVPLSASFADAGTNDTHTATVDWGDGTPLVAAVVTQSAGSGTIQVAPHAYASPGPKTITVTVTDDDGGVGQTTVIIVVLTGSQAMGDVLADLRAIAADPAQPDAVRAAAAQAVVLLDGVRDGLANNGSLDKLRDGDDAAALLKLRDVIAVLMAVPETSRPPEMTLDAYILARIAESVATGHYDAAVTGLVSPTPDQLAEVNAIGAILAAGRAAVADGDLLTAIDNFLEVLRRSDGLLTP